MSYNYSFSITICSIWNREQSCLITKSGNIEAESKSAGYSELHNKEYLKEIFDEQYPEMSYSKLAVLYCKIW